MIVQLRVGQEPQQLHGADDPADLAERLVELAEQAVDVPVTGGRYVASEILVPASDLASSPPPDPDAASVTSLDPFAIGQQLAPLQRSLAFHGQLAAADQLSRSGPGIWSRGRPAPRGLDGSQATQYGFTVVTDKPVRGDGDGEASPIEFYLDRGAGVPTYLQLVHQVDYALRLGFLAVGDRLPRIKDVTRALAVNPDTVMKAYRELEVRGIAAGRPGLGTFIIAVPDVAGLREMAALQRKLTSWLAEAGAAGVDELGMKALFAAALRDFHYGGGTGGRLPDREVRDRGGGAA